ncbi:unnamed protein product [Phaeothamnion confervicola]
MSPGLGAPSNSICFCEVSFYLSLDKASTTSKYETMQPPPMAGATPLTPTTLLCPDLFVSSVRTGTTMNSLVATSRRSAMGLLRRAPQARMPAATSVFPAGARQNSTLEAVYNRVWKSNAGYITYIVVGAIALEMVYGKATDALWDSVNKGKQYKDIDWSKFKTEDDEDEEEQEE